MQELEQARQKVSPRKNLTNNCLENEKTDNESGYLIANKIGNYFNSAIERVGK